MRLAYTLLQTGLFSDTISLSKGSKVVTLTTPFYKGESMNNLHLIFDILKRYRLHSKYYINMSYFCLISTLILFYSRYIVSHHIKPLPLITLLLPFFVLIIIPIGGLYYIVRMGVDISKIGKNKFDASHTNKLIWLSDSIYIVLIVLANTLCYFIDKVLPL